MKRWLYIKVKIGVLCKREFIKRGKGGIITTLFFVFILNLKRDKMTEKLLRYDLILQNCGSKEYKIYQKLENISNDPLILTFNIDLSEMVEGEYNYAVIVNMRNDVVYDFKAELTKTVLRTEEGDIRLDKLNPQIGIMKIDGNKNQPIYFENKIEYLYL